MDPYGASSSTTGSAADLPGRIRKRRYSTARIQPTRIKKVMQSDEDIGRMIASVPVSIGAVMEHFTEKLLENAANIMHESVSKTLSPAHIFTAVNRIPYYSFLQPVVKNFGGGATATSTSSPVTTPTNGLFSKPFEQHYSTMKLDEQPQGLHYTPLQLQHPTATYEEPALPVLEETYDSNAYMTETAAKAPVAKNNANDESLVKRRRGRPRKDDKDNKSKQAIVSILSTTTTSSYNPSIGHNGISSKADLDRVLMPPPSLLPQRKTLPSLNPKIIIPKTMISSSPTTLSSSVPTQSNNNNSMVNSSSSSKDQKPQKADAISA